MRSLLRFTLRALILLTVALVSALLTMRYAIHGREVEVPNLVGMPPAAAERVALDHGLLFTVGSRYYSAEVPQGRVVSQEPRAGERVRRGWRVQAAESLGPQRVLIPNVVGSSVRAAEIDIRRRGLDLGSVVSVHLGDEPPDEVIAQSPPAEARQALSPRLNLLVSAPAEPAAYVMPNLAGRRLDEAAAAIAKAGLRLGPVTEAAADPAAPRATETRVLSQSPAPGQKVTAGMTVKLEITR